MKPEDVKEAGFYWAKNKMCPQLGWEPVEVTPEELDSCVRTIGYDRVSIFFFSEYFGPLPHPRRDESADAFEHRLELAQIPTRAMAFLAGAALAAIAFTLILAGFHK